LVPLFRADQRKPLSVENIGLPGEIEGELEGYVVVSIPETETHASARTVRETLSKALGKPILIVTHNVEFLVTKRLPPKEGAKVIKRMEDALDALANQSNASSDGSAAGSAADSAPATGVGAEQRPGGDGDRPGTGIDGSGGAEPELSKPASDTARSGDRNGEGEEKGPDGSAGVSG
jgi:hypothetical protein